MYMSCLCPPRRDQVSIHIKRQIDRGLWRAIEFKKSKPRFFIGFPQGHLPSKGMSIAMAPELEPSTEFFVVGQQHCIASVRDHHRRPRDMARRMIPLEACRRGLDKGDDLF